MVDLAQLENRDSWDTYFMKLAEESAKRSKDSSTKVGSCLVKDRRVLSMGYNGAPRNFPDIEVPQIQDYSSPLRDQKNSYMCHSELNAILNYSGSLRDLEGATLYVTVSPCHECAKAIIQAGISKVIYLNEYHRTEMWKMSKILFDKCNVKYAKLNTLNSV